jgi:flagellin
MSVVINTNSSATIAANNLSASNAMLQRSLNRLSSGSRIVNASDDAGGVAVAGRLGAASKRVGVITQNIGNTISFLQHQDNALKTLSKMLERMSELQSLYTDATKSSADLGLYKTEFDKLGVAVKDILDNTDFNGNDVFGAVATRVNDDAAAGTNFSSDALTGLTSTIKAYGVTTSTAEGAQAIAAGLGTVDPTASTPLVGTAKADITGDIGRIAEARAKNGAAQSTLGFYSEINTSAKANFQSAISRIVDVDVAEESTQLARWNTLVQAGTAMVAQANATTQGVLTLLRG